MKADEFGPGDQIGCGHDDFKPSSVGVKRVKRQVTQPGDLGLADAVLDAGVLAVAQFQAGELTRYHRISGVGQEPCDAVPVGIGERQLGAGMRAFFAQDQPGPSRPFRQVDQIGGLGHPGTVADAAVALIAGYHAAVVVSVSAASRIAASIAQPSENPTPAWRQAAANP